jgi:hypothetical protein
MTDFLHLGISLYFVSGFRGFMYRVVALYTYIFQRQVLTLLSSLAITLTPFSSPHLPPFFYSFPCFIRHCFSCFRVGQCKIKQKVQVSVCFVRFLYVSVQFGKYCSTNKEHLKQQWTCIGTLLGPIPSFPGL